MPLDPPFSLGADLRALRKARGLTLTAVAEALEKSVGWLSQVERDLSHPTLPDIRQLADLYQVTVPFLLGQDNAPPEEQGRIVRAAARRPVGTSQDGLVEELLSPDLTDDFEVIYSTFAPGAALKKPKLRPTQEIGYLISGALTLWIGEAVFEITPGDSFRIRAEPYRWANPHPDPAVALWVIAPPVY